MMSSGWNAGATTPPQQVWCTNQRQIHGRKVHGRNEYTCSFHKSPIKAYELAQTRNNQSFILKSLLSQFLIILTSPLSPPDSLLVAKNATY
ncbi:hypothetical protein BDV93DRAFT_128914 [Ceratobasidium sp. AG-I]|nr:hypothetical protein BDV93DRAFT_128914 [Ceratobasidium sp. AG-I]